MASFRVLQGEDGFSGFDVDFAQLAALSTDEAASIVMAGAEIFRRRISEYIDAHHHNTGTLAQSFTAKVLTYFPTTAYVMPKGKNHGRSSSTRGTHRSKTGQGKSHLRSHHGMAAGISNVDVLYYLEYGTPRTAPAHVVETVCQQAREEVSDAMEAAFNEILARKGL